MSLVTAELRWFLAPGHDQILQEFERWFKAGTHVGGGKGLRTDAYLFDPSTDELGVKDRGSKPGLEVKTLVEPNLCSLTFGGRSGVVQVWSKVESLGLELPEHPARRVMVGKRRWLRQFDVSDGVVEVTLGAGDLGEDPQSGVRTALGCNVDFTELTLSGAGLRSSSFGFEAFTLGHRLDHARLALILRNTILSLGEQLGQPPELSSAWEELSYPGWIKRCLAG